MAVFEYKGHQFEADENMSESDWAQTTAYLDTLPPKETTTTESTQSKGHDLTSYLNPATINDFAASGIASILGQQKSSDRLYKQAQDRLTKSDNSSIYDTIRDTSMAGTDMLAGIVGMPVAAIAGTGRALLDGPSAGLETAKKVMGNLTYSHLIGADKQMAESPAYQASMLPFNALTSGLETSNKGYQEIAKSLGVDKDTAKQFGDMVELGLIAVPGLHAAKGMYSSGKEIYTAVKENRAQLKAIKDYEDSINKQGERTPDEIHFAKTSLKIVEDKIAAIDQWVEDLVNEGTLKDTESLNEHLLNLEKDKNTLLQKQQELQAIIEGRALPPKLDEAMQHAKKIEEVKQNMASREKPIPDEEANALNEKLREEQIKKQQDAGPTIPDYITEPEKFVQAIEEQGKPKTTPTEIALTKIGEAKNMTDAELADHILNTEDKLSLIEDKPENSSLRENIKAELRAYEDIQAGREPDLSWFTNEEKPTIESITVKKPSIFKSEREALESSYIDGLVKTIEEFKPYKQEMDYLKDTRNPTIEQSLRLQELEDIYNKLLIKNDPINEYHGVRNTYVEELQLLKDLEKSDPDYVNQRRPLVEDMLTKLDEYRNKAEGNVSTEKPVVEDIIQIEAPKPNFTSIDDIFAYQGDTLTHLVDHSTEFFNRMSDRQYFIDKRIGELPKGDMITKMIGNMLDKVGLNKDRIFVTLEDKLNSGGKLNHFDDTSVIRLNREQLAKYAKTAIDNPSLFEGIRASNLEGAKLAYATIRVVSHEIGHIFTNKYLRSFGTMDNIHETIGKFKEYLKDNRIENISYQDWYDGGVSAQKLRDVQQYFHEFVAERVANHLLGDKDLMKGFRSDKTKSFRAVLEAGYKILKDYGLKIKDKTSYFDDVIKDILDTNKELVAKTGDTVWENADIANTDGYIFRGKTLQEVLNSDIVQAMLPEKKANEIFMGYDTIDHPSFSERAGRALGKGTLKVAEVFFQRANIVDMNFMDKPLTYFHKTARSIDFLVESITNRLLYGDVMPKDVGFFSVFSKVKSGDSPYMTLKQSSRIDKFLLHEVFKKGFEEGLDYQTNLEKNGQHLTKTQRGYYNSLAKLFTNMYEESIKVQKELGKKHELPQREGWYPSARSGRYSVSVNYGDLVAHAQQFQTKLQAEKFREQLLNSKIKHFNISDVVDLKDQPKNFNNLDVVESLVESFSRLVPKEKEFFNNQGKKVLQSMLERGGKLGQHHKYRFNVEGYMGNELFRTPSELGESFGLAIEQAIAEKGMQIKEMHYKSKLQHILENPDLKKSHPNTIATMQTMFDSALGRHVNNLNAFQESYQYLGDKFVDEFLKVFNSEKTSDKSATAVTYDSMRSGLYLMYMMPKAVFSTIGQLVSVPPMAVAKMSYERPLGAWKDMSMGTMKMLTGNKDLWSALKEVSQKYNVFEPQYVESLTLHKTGPKIVEFIKDWALLRAPGKGFESGSRVWAFSVFYEHAKQIGMGRQEAIEFAMRKTGDSLNLYDKANTPPIFEKLGFVGDLVKPLASFGQNQLGNTIAMAKYGLSGGPKKWMPLISYSVLTVTLVGGLGIQGMQEYEEFRKWLDRNDYAHLPSILDILATKREGLDDVISPETRTLGLLSKTGYDVASSARANKTLPTMLAQEITAGMHLDKNGDKATPYDVMPLVSSAMKVPAAVTTLLSAITGRETTGSVKKAMDVLAPAGHVGYGIKEAMGINETTIGGKNTGMKMVGNEGQAGFKRTPEDIKAGIIGTKTTEDKMTQLRDYEVQEEEKTRVEKLNKYGIMAVESGDPRWIKKMVDLGETTKNINNKLELEYSKRLIPLELRLMINTKGKIIKGRGERQAIGLSQFKK